MNQYHVICRGEILPGHDPEMATQTLAAQFKVPSQVLNRLTSGRAVTVKRNTDRKTAEKYQRAAEKCGVRFHVLPVENNTPHESSNPPADTSQPVRVSRSMTCLHCGFEQALSSTCIQCGKFAAESENTEISQTSPSAHKTGPLAFQQTKPPAKGLFKKIRIAILVAILIAAGLSTWRMYLKVVSWNIPLTVAIYPINADGSHRASGYIEMLYQEDFDPIKVYLAQEAKKYGLGLDEPFRLVLGDTIDELPPKPPEKKGVLSVIWWSLKLRFWAYFTGSQKGISPDIKMFVLYYDAQHNVQLEHSLGLKKAMIGVVHAYADTRATEHNHVIITHEILHTVGATDKYDPVNHQPVFPEGYAEPDLEYPYPQRLAEIMGSRIPITQTTSNMPPDLDHTLVGPLTAQEIRWTDE